MTDRTNILITGTKSGIGQGLLQHYAALPHSTIIAAIRDEPTSDTAKAMISYVTTLGESTNIIAMQYDAGVMDSAHKLIQRLTEEHPEVDRLDLVIANAAMSTQHGPVSSVTADDLAFHFAVNAIAPTMLYQATRELLLASPANANPRFCLISTVAGSIENIPNLPLPIIAYGMSKVGANYFVRKANNEEERLTLVAIHPGWVQTAPGNAAAVAVGLKEAPMTIVECVNRLTAIMEKATKEIGGTFQTVDGGTLPW